jgi:hypothetical protein
MTSILAIHVRRPYPPACLLRELVGAAMPREAT